MILDFRTYALVSWIALLGGCLPADQLSDWPQVDGRSTAEPLQAAQNPRILTDSKPRNLWAERVQRVGSAKIRYLSDSELSEIRKKMPALRNDDSVVPTGAYPKAPPPICRSEALEAWLLRAGADPRIQAAVVEQFLGECRSYLKSDDERSAFWAVVRGLNYFHDPLKNPKIKAVEVKSVHGYITKGLLAMQSGPGKRPLVIVRCGLRCDVFNPSSTRYLIMLFEEGPFHVLLMPSHSGEHFLSDNGVFSFGGFEEGREMIEAALALTDPASEWAGKISSLHVVGSSLGGHASLYTALYNSLLPGTDADEPLIRSFQAYCPVVDLENSVRETFRPGLLNNRFYERFWSNFQKAWPKLPPEFIAEIGDPDAPPPIREVPDIAAKMTALQFSKQSRKSGWALTPFEQSKFSTISDVFSLNRFQSYSDKVTSPVFVWAADDDAIVVSDKNSVLLKNSLSSSNTHFGFAMTPKGSHCEMSNAYSWPIEGTILRSLILAHSPEYVGSIKKQFIPVQRLLNADPMTFTMKYRRADDVRFDVKPNSRNIQIIFTYRARQLDLQPRSAFDGRDFTEVYSFPRRWIAELPGVWDFGSDPTTVDQAEAQVRWLNARLRPVFSDEAYGQTVDAGIWGLLGFVLDLQSQ